MALLFPLVILLHLVLATPLMSTSVADAAVSRWHHMRRMVQEGPDFVLSSVAKAIRLPTGQRPPQIDAIYVRSVGGPFSVHRIVKGKAEVMEKKDFMKMTPGQILCQGGKNDPIKGHHKYVLFFCIHI
jgi:hypothetical protein